MNRAVGVLAVCVGALFASATTADANYEAPATYSAGLSPTGMASGDFNGDTFADLAVANFSSGDVSLLLGDGDGTFTPGISMTSGYHPVSVGTADLNGDGDADLAVANAGGDDVSIFMGNGDGTFDDAVSRTVSPAATPTDIAIADMNGDSRPDLVTSDGASNSVAINLQNPAGAFLSAQTYPAGLNPSSVAIDNFNSGTVPDVVTADRGDGTVSIFLGNGDGTLQARQAKVVGGGPVAVATGKLAGSNDSTVDLAVANSDTDNVSVLNGNGAGGFSTAKNFGVGDYPTSVLIKNLNGGGGLADADDVLTTNTHSDNLSLVGGSGDGQSFWQPPFNYSTGDGPGSAVADDFNGDGVPDIANVNVGDNDVSVLIGKGPEVTVDSSHLVFPDTEIDEATSGQYMAITNHSDNYWLITKHVSISGPDASSFVAKNECENRLWGPTPCIEGVSFQPKKAGPLSATLSITHDGPGPAYSAPLRGMGLEPPAKPICPKALQLRLADFNPKPPYGKSNHLKGLRAEISANYRHVVARMTPWIGYRINGQWNRVALEHKNLIINSSRRLRFQIPDEIKDAIHADGRRLRGTRLLLALRSRVEPLGDPECQTGIQMQSVMTRIVGISSRSGGGLFDQR